MSRIIYQGGLCVNYEIKHFDIILVRYSATEDSNTPKINIMWINQAKKGIYTT